MGYNENPNAYHLYDPSTNKVIERRDVAFENVLSHGSLRSYPTLIVEASSPAILVDHSLSKPNDPSPFGASSSTSSKVDQWTIHDGTSFDDLFGTNC